MNTMSMPNANLKRVAVIGGGASGMLATALLLLEHVDVTLFEHQSETGKKLRITGKGRCNLTNNCTPEEFLREVPRNPRFLYSAINACPPAWVMEFFEGLGVPLKTERGRRVFPVSDRSSDVVNALRRAIRTAHLAHAKVTRIEKRCDADGAAFSLTAGGVSYDFDAVLLASGGKSYPLTGSDGSGYAFATVLGHTVTPLVPSLVPLESASPLCPDMQGVAPKNVSFSVKERASGRVVYKDFGELLFTHFGISGPVVLSASAHLRDMDISALDAVIDWKPALDEKTLDARLLSDFGKYANRTLQNAMADLLPSRVIPPLLTLAGVDAEKKANVLTREERRAIRHALKNFTIPLLRTRQIEEAVITSGGIDVREVSPKTMMSKKAEGLFFAGEVLDVDAYTGGYNLQIAFSTAYLAAKGIVSYLDDKNSQ